MVAVVAPVRSDLRIQLRFYLAIKISEILDHKRLLFPVCPSLGKGDTKFFCTNPAVTPIIFFNLKLSKHILIDNSLTMLECIL